MLHLNAPNNTLKLYNLSLYHFVYFKSFIKRQKENVT